MEKSTPESTTQRPGRGTRGARILALRGTQSGRSTSPRNKSPASKPPTEEKTRPIRGAQSGSRGSRIPRQGEEAELWEEKIDQDQDNPTSEED